MTVQQLIDRLNKNRIELYDLSMDLANHPQIKEFDFETTFSQISTAQRLIEFSLRFLHKMHPETHFSFSEAIKKPKAELILLCSEGGAYASGQRSGAPDRTGKASEVH